MRPLMRGENHFADYAVPKQTEKVFHTIIFFFSVNTSCKVARERALRNRATTMPRSTGVCRSSRCRRQTGAAGARERARYRRSGGGGDALACCSDRHQRTPTATAARPDCDWPPRSPPRPAADRQLQHPPRV